MRTQNYTVLRIHEISKYFNLPWTTFNCASTDIQDIYFPPWKTKQIHSYSVAKYTRNITLHYIEMQVSHWHSAKIMLSQITCNTQHVTNKTRTRLAHWHTLPISCLHHISNIFHINTIHHKIISMLLTDSISINTTH